MSLVELARYFTAMEAEINRTRLLSFGIETIVFDGSMNIADGANLNARLMILAEDYDEAITIMSTYENVKDIQKTPYSAPKLRKWRIWDLIGGW